MSIALHAGPETEVDGWRPPHPELVHLCYELQGGPAVLLTILALQRVAAAWRGSGTFEERLLATLRAAQAEGPQVWFSIINAREEQTRYDEEMFRRYLIELQQKAEDSTSEGMYRLRRKFCAEEVRSFRSRFVESCTPLETPHQ